MGSTEGIRQAEQALADAARSGKILLLKNTHLCSGWLASTLEKRMQILRPNPNFRLFLTMEMGPKVNPGPLESSYLRAHAVPFLSDPDVNPSKLSRPHASACDGIEGQPPDQLAGSAVQQHRPG